MGIQDDGETFVAGPDACFHVSQGRVSRISVQDSGYAWIPCQLKVLEVPDSVSQTETDMAVSLLEEVLLGPILLRFQLIVGEL